MSSPRIICAFLGACVFSCFLLNSPSTAELVEAYGDLPDVDQNGSGTYGSSSISGYLFNDLNNDAAWQPWEHRLIGVHIRLERLDAEGLPEQIYDAWTDRYGQYRFEHLPEGIYSILKLGTNQVYNDGQQVLGMLGAPDWMRGEIFDGGQDGIDRFVGIVLRPETDATGYLFSAWGIRPEGISKAHFTLGYYYIPEPSGGLLASFGTVLLMGYRLRPPRRRGQ